MFVLEVMATAADFEKGLRTKTKSPATSQKFTVFRDEIGPLSKKVRARSFSEIGEWFLGREGRKHSDPATSHQTGENLQPAVSRLLFPAWIRE